tara:strand:- start:97 stop:327 length:231 start_codon:yes stop_codon:yes gene_type:complete
MYFEIIGTKFVIDETKAAKITTEKIDVFIKLFSNKLPERYFPIGKLTARTAEKIKKKKILTKYNGKISNKFIEKNI